MLPEEAYYSVQETLTSPPLPDRFDPTICPRPLTCRGRIPCRRKIRLKPNTAEGTAGMADDPIIDIDLSAFSEDERSIVLRACFGAHDVSLLKEMEARV